MSELQIAMTRTLANTSASIVWVKSCIQPLQAMHDGRCEYPLYVCQDENTMIQKVKRKQRNLG